MYQNEQELAARVLRNIQLHEAFANGEYNEMNSYISDDFHGWIYIPRNGIGENYDAHQIREGNQQAAEYYKGQKIRFICTGLKILPQSETQAAVSYEIIHKHDEKVLRALSLEVWQKEVDGEWRMIRCFMEKGMPI